MPSLQHKTRQRLQQPLTQFRHAVARTEALPQLSLLGFFCGLLAAAIIMAFRWCAEQPITLLLSNELGDFENLSPLWRVALVMGGTLLLILWMRSRRPEHRATSVPHVLDRMAQHQGHLPVGNWLTQFVGASIALLSGQSVGREGPAVHLGAGAGSFISTWLKLPKNSLHTLIGCGVAAAIAASFNTPLAGVIFAMEVVLMEYTIAGFIPVIIASLTATIATRFFFSDEIAFIVPPVSLHSLSELPLLALGGVIMALFATLYMRTLLLCNHLQHSLTVKFLIAGSFTALIAFFVPGVMGLGYDSLNQMLNNQITLHNLIILAGAKLLATAVTIGMGIPGGVIGPLLVIGGAVGGIFALSAPLFTHANADVGLYVLLGMGTMMAAVLNAPLAALIAMLEMTYNPNIILPGLVMIVSASLATHYLFGPLSIFQAILAAQGKLHKPSPLLDALRRVGVVQLMCKDIYSCPRIISRQEAEKILKLQPQWIVFKHEDSSMLLNPRTLSVFLASEEENKSEIDLLAIPGQRYNLSLIDTQATGLDASKLLDDINIEALLVTSQEDPGHDSVLGIITDTELKNVYSPSTSSQR